MLLGLARPFAPTVAIAYKDFVRGKSVCISVVGRTPRLRCTSPRSGHDLEETHRTTWIVCARIKSRLTTRNIHCCGSIGPEYLADDGRNTASSRWCWDRRWWWIIGHTCRRHDHRRGLFRLLYLLWWIIVRDRRGMWDYPYLLYLCTRRETLYGYTHDLTYEYQVRINNTTIRC